MRSLRLVVPAALVILSMSFAPAQAAPGDDPGSGGFLGQLFRSLSSSSVDDPPIDTSDETDPPVVTQPVDPPPPPKKKFTLPLTLPVDPPPDTDKAVTPPVDPSPTNPGNLLQVPETPLDVPTEEEQTGELAANDDQYDVEQNSGATSLAVTSNDNGTITAVQAASMPSNGELDQTEMTSFSYTPDPDFVGADSFTYQAKDANQATSNTATVTINVTPQGVNEDPVADPGQGERNGSFDEEEEEDEGDDDSRRHHKHDDDDDDDDGDRRCHRHDHDDHHHGDHHGDHDGDHHGDHDGDNEWDEWNKDWNHDWDDEEHGDDDHFRHHKHHDDDDRCHRDDDDDDDGGDLPDTGSPVNLPLLALSGLLVIAGAAVVRRTRG